jgi:hypothetical protein
MTTSPKVFVTGIFAAAALWAVAGTAPAVADDNRDRAAAIQACKVVVSDELRIPVADVRLEKIRTRARVIEVTVEARRENSRLALADCTYNRSGGKVDVVMTPALGRPAGA